MKNSLFIKELHVLIEVFILMLVIVSAALLIAVLFFPLSPEQVADIDQLDLAIACVFLAEFIVRLLVSENMSEFLKRSWWEVLAAIPITNELTQTLRLLRILRVGRLLLHIGVIRRGNGNK